MTSKFKTRVLAEHGPGRVTMSTCALCGWFEWHQTESDKPDEVVVKERSPNGCPRCDTAFERAPEVAAWVQGIVIKLRSDLAPKAPIFDAEKILDAADEALRRRDHYPDVDTPQLRAVVEALVAALSLNVRAPRSNIDLGHAPIATADLSQITGCSCGWKTPPGATDSDDEFAGHIAMERTL